MIEQYDLGASVAGPYNMLAAMQLAKARTNALRAAQQQDTPVYNALKTHGGPTRAAAASMDGVDFTPHLVGGGLREDAISGLAPDLHAALSGMYAAAPDDIRQQLYITSAYRSPEVQERLWNDALKKYGSAEAARKWVAPPGRSHHNSGGAVDFKYGNDAARAWAHENAANHGLHFPMEWEPWHIELAGSRG